MSEITIRMRHPAGNVLFMPTDVSLRLFIKDSLRLIVHISILAPIHPPPPPIPIHSPLISLPNPPFPPRTKRTMIAKAFSLSCAALHFSLFQCSVLLRQRNRNQSTLCVLFSTNLRLYLCADITQCLVNDCIFV